MDNKNNTWDAQDAPVKNTDNAFVQVGTDGKPQMPEEQESSEKETGTTTDSNKEDS